MAPLAAQAPPVTRLDRREFVTWSLGGAFLLALGTQADAAANVGAAVSPWVRIDADGSITLISTVSDMGQGSRTGQAQVLADELEAPWEAITVETAPDADPFRHDGELITGGSQSLRTRYHLLRRAGAAARAQLVAAAAARWGVPAADCDAVQGVVRHAASGRSLSYGELAAAAAALPPPDNPPLKDPAAFRYIGKSVPILGMADRVDGRAVYGIDVRLPGMLHASVRQSPTFGGELASVDEGPALAVRGVRKVVRLPTGVAVIADNTWAAFKGVRALDPKWTAPDRRSNSTDMGRTLAAACDAPNAEIVPRANGEAARASLRAAWAPAARKVEATYEVPYLSHSPLEPMNATARVTADAVEIWAPDQHPTGLRVQVARALDRPLEQVRLTTTLLGGGFGRRLKSDYAVIAALVAREASAPVQVLWTREEDMTHDFYRPRAMMTWRATIGADGVLAGYEMVGAACDDSITGGAAPAPYDLPLWAGTQTRVAMGVPVGAWRSVDEYTTTFMRESFIDECAHAAGADPVAYRRGLLAHNERALRVLEAVATKIGWDTPRAPGVGRGVAVLEAWETHVAHAIEVEVRGKTLTVRRAVVAIDPGPVINPDQVGAQAEGGTTLGLSAALGEEITITDGKADQANFDAYKILRHGQAPPVEAIVLESPRARIGGVGEPPVPGVAPALANAVFAATGRRVRSLPFSAAGFEV